MNEIGVLPLHGVVQHYDWGGYDFIPGLLGIANSDRRPFAELWMGAHPKAPATARPARNEFMSIFRLTVTEFAVPKPDERVSVLRPRSFCGHIGDCHLPSFGQRAVALSAS
jgi:hypothetical protein